MLLILSGLSKYLFFSGPNSSSICHPIHHVPFPKKLPVFLLFFYEVNSQRRREEAFGRRSLWQIATVNCLTAQLASGHRPKAKNLPALEHLSRVLQSVAYREFSLSMLTHSSWTRNPSWSMSKSWKRALQNGSSAKRSLREIRLSIRRVRHFDTNRF